MDICPCNICPGDICPYWQYLSCYWPDFDQILKVGSWDLLKHIPTVTVTFFFAKKKGMNTKFFRKEKFSPKRILTEKKMFAKTNSVERPMEQF